MQRLRVFSSNVWVLVVLIASGCSWIESYELKSEVKEQLAKDFETTLKKEADDNLNPSSQRKGDYVKFVQAHTNFEILNIKKISEREMLVSLKLHTVAGETRQTLLAILKPLEGRTANAFNFSEAVSLIHQNQPGLKIESDQDLQIQVHR